MKGTEAGGRIEPRGNEPRGSEPKTGSRSTLVFILVFLLYLFDYIDRQVVAALFPYLKADLGLTDTQTGLLVSAVYWSIVAFAFPASILVDRWSRKYSIGIMVALWSLATGAAAFVKTFPSLLLTRFGVGVGESGYSPGGTAMISALYPAEKRSRMLGWWNASIPLGSMLGLLIGAFVAARWGWQRAFGLVAIPGFAVGLLFLLLARDYRTVKLEVPAHAAAARRKMRAREIAQEFLRKPSLLLTYAGFAANTFLTTSYVNWLPTYFNRFWDMPVTRASLMTGLVLIFSAAGAPAGGFLADRWGRRRENARPLFAGVSSLASAVIWMAAFGLMHGTPQLVVMMLGAAVSVLYVSGAAALTQDVVHPGLWAVSWSLCVIVQNLLGSSLGPLVTGAISDWRGLRTAFLVVPAASVVAGGLFLAASRFYVRDKARVDPVEVTVDRTNSAA